MTTKAGDNFICSNCKEEHETADASYDEQCNGPVCDTCRRYFIKALAYLRHEGINRPLDTGDVNEKNHNRLRHLM
jgi:hypothetical protein